MDAEMVSSFRKLFTWLGDTHWHLINEGLTEDHRNTFGELQVNYPIADDKALESLLPSPERPTCDFTEARKFLYLAPNADKKKLGFLPFVGLQCDLGSTPTKTQFYVGHATRSAKDGTIRTFGLRYEGPEGAGDGMHDFYHAQIITSFRAGGTSLNSEDADLEWLPVRQPSIPLDATCPVTLALAVLVGIYGRRYLDEIARSGTVPKPYFEKMLCRQQAAH